ncbi:chloride channel protein [Arabiibacter massiliensis]|uniref:chloride channel protein n=1 Tax=Arabiibacter massiliensis TaxID=1870985 RepID=UPI00155AF980|nr:chloride channel protein [Arabiibacter massiliensis]
MEQRETEADETLGEADPARIGIARALGLGVAAAVLGAGVGFAIWALLSSAYWLTDIVWTGARGMLGEPAFSLFPLIACTTGGLFIGLWNARFRSAPKPLDEVMAEVRAKGGYSVGRIAPSAVSFLLPIAFGGSVGPEAGLTGLVAAGCTWVGAKLRRLAGVEGAFSLRQKIPLYALGVAGGVAGVAAFGALLGGGMPIPHFDAAPLSWEAAAWCVPLALVGWAMAVLYGLAVRASRHLAATLGDRPVLKPLLCGIALGAVALALPYVLFPGTQQASDLAASWTGMEAAGLFATGLIKLAFIALCLNLGWSGGPFFPLIFCGVSVGFGFAATLGAPAELAVAVVTSALIGGFTRKPAMTALIMLLCFPVQDLPWLAVAIAVGAFLPQPSTRL